MPEPDQPLLQSARLIADAASFDPHHLSSAEVGLLVRAVRELADRLDEIARASHELPHQQAECPFCMAARWILTGIRPAAAAGSGGARG